MLVLRDDWVQLRIATAFAFASIHMLELEGPCNVRSEFCAAALSKDESQWL